MACKEWNDEWIAELYGELESAESERLQGHLEDCRDCRRTLDRLAGSRELLSAAAPAVPSAPRVVCIDSGRSRLSPLWAFAAGLACATIAFAIGLAAAGTMASNGEVEPQAIGAAAESGLEIERERAIWNARMEQMEQRVAELEELKPAVDDPADRSDSAAAYELASRLSNLEQRIDLERANDLDFLLSEINTVERRAGDWIGETREALRLVALQSDPRVSHQ